MPRVIAFEDAQANQFRSNAGSLRTVFLKNSRDAPDSPSVFVTRQDAGSFRGAHFHEIDQFQLIIDGKGEFGRHSVSPYSLHFSRAYTAYGPLRADKDGEFAFLVLRSRFDPGHQDLPKAADKLKQVAGRLPWQATKKITFPTQGPGISLQEVPEIKDDQGLFVCALTMAPHSRTVAPDPSGGDGQFVVVVKGSLIYDGREHNALTVAFVKPEENAFWIDAGAQGLEALVLNLPQVKPRAVDARVTSTADGFRKWRCELCSFSYDEALGMPEEGIAAGTRWQDVPDSWSCPDCSASKGDFQMVEA